MSLKEYTEFLKKTKDHSGILNSYYKSSDASSRVFTIARGLLSSWCSKNKVNPYSGDIKEGIKFSYEHIQDIPKLWITSSLGVGGFGVVLSHSPGKVRKISYLDFLPEETKFYQYCLKNHLSIFPRIYQVSKNEVVMEKLDMETPKLDPYIERYIKWVPTSTFPYREAKWGLIYSELGKNHWFTKFLEEIQGGLYDIYKIKTIGDFQSKNIGTRENGEYVFFDPVAGKILTK